MRHEDKTKGQLIGELDRMRQQSNELGENKAEQNKAEEALRRSEGRYRVLKKQRI